MSKLTCPKRHFCQLNKVAKRPHGYLIFWVKKSSFQIVLCLPNYLLVMCYVPTLYIFYLPIILQPRIARPNIQLNYYAYRQVGQGRHLLNLFTYYFTQVIRQVASYVKLDHIIFCKPRTCMAMFGCRQVLESETCLNPSILWLFTINLL